MDDSAVLEYDPSPAHHAVSANMLICATAYDRISGSVITRTARLGSPSMTSKSLL